MTVANWRDLVKVHPAADLFPMMSDAELDELAKDIDKPGHSLRVPLSLWRAHEGADWQLLDGRNRVAAMARLVGGVDRIEGAVGAANTYEAHVDPWAFAISANILRRHLDAEQKRKLIADLMLADPTRSNRAIAALAKASDHAVANVRNDLEDGARIAHHAERVGKDGIAQPAHKQPTHRQPPAAVIRNTTPHPAAPISKEQQLRELREHPRTPPKPLPLASSVVRNVQTAAENLTAGNWSNKFTIADSLPAVLRGDLGRVDQIPIARRVALVRGCMNALGVTDDDMKPIGGAP